MGVFVKGIEPKKYDEERVLIVRFSSNKIRGNERQIVRFIYVLV